MNKIVKLLGIALMATSMAFVSCDDDESSTNNNQKPPVNQNDINLAEVNIADNTFYLTKVFCEDFSDADNSWLLGGIANGTLHYDLHFAPGDENNNYKNTEFNFIIDGRSNVDMVVEEYNPATQYLELSTSQDAYSGTITLTQDADNVYMAWEGESYRGGQSAKLEGWRDKTKLHLPEK